MQNTAKSRRFLAAVDLDGTLLDETGVVSEANLRALDLLADRGFVVALASGRHPVDMVRLAARLPTVTWMVSCQGCEVSDVLRASILGRAFLPSGVASRVAEAGRRAGYGVVAYTSDGEVTPWAHDEIARYESVSKTQVQPIDPARLVADRFFKIMWVAGTDRIDALIAAGGPGLAAVDADTVRSHDYVFEFVPQRISKATGVATLARHLGIARDAVVAFGDADNDVPLFTWAGRSIAMAHARPHVRARATAVAPSGTPGAAFARGVAGLLAGDLTPILA